MDPKKLYPLNDGWLLIDGNACGSASFHACGIPAENAVKADLPSFTHMYIPDHVGISWYEKTFSLSTLPEPDETALLRFEQADFRTEVSVNGSIAGVHTGVEDPFSFDVTGLLRAGENRVTVRVSKPHEIPVDGYAFEEIPRRNQTARGLIPGSCYNESGLCGEVSLRILPRVRIEDLCLVPDADTGAVQILVTAQNGYASAVSAVLSLEIRRSPDGETEDFTETSFTLSPGENILKAELTVPSPRLWSTEDPNLYSVRVELSSGKRSHTAAKKTGFRTFIVDGAGYFRLNGKRIYLRSSHTGNCMPESTHHISRNPELLRRDFLLAKAAGFNTLRFISGAALPLQLDLCDEIGLMVYEEPVSSWLELNGPHAAELYLHDLLTMVRRDRSHPSVTIWGLLNETYSTPPFDDVCNAARDALPELRKLDDTRLVLFSSGRWDSYIDVGSLANPGSDKWQNLWGSDGDASASGDRGDIHYYPDSVPLRAPAQKRMRSFGSASGRPVFVSESGVGSVLDTVSLVRRFAQDGAVEFCPDVKMIGRINGIFLSELEKYGFSDCIPFPSELMRRSMENHAYYRTQAFDQLRANPSLCGISITGLLDHAICGEGLWTLHRSFKPMIADVLQDGFSPLRWCVFLSAPAVFPGRPLTVEAALATEDVLTVGKEYTVRAGIIGPDGASGVRTYRFTVTDEQARRMVVPVFTDTWATDGLPAGKYEFKAELVSGADASGGIRGFHVIPRARSERSRTVCAAGLTPAEIELISGFGFAVADIGAYEAGVPVLAGRVDKALAAKLAPLIGLGAHVVALRAGEEEDLSAELLPEDRRPKLNRSTDWLYHRETVLRPGGRFFSGMQTGAADALLYTGLVNGNHFDAENAQVPDETDAIAFSTGYPNDRGYIGGFKLGTYRLGAGALTLSAFDLLDRADSVPYAARLLVNLLENA